MAWRPVPAAAVSENLHTIRLSVNRQTAALEGDLKDGTGKSIGRIDMRCEPTDNESVPERKF
ncbi:MAG: hypothetical protein ABIN96_11110 [Rubrivivax sp.]